jgi:hypothetical protein
MESRNAHKGIRPLVIAAGIIAAVVVAGWESAYAGFSKGGAFVSPGYGARAWGMGGAVVATLDDEGSVYWNPGMMALVGANTVGASYIDLVAGATAHQSQLAYVHVLKTNDPDEADRTMARHAAGALYTNLRLGIQSGESYEENTLRVAYAYTPDYFISFAFAAEAFASHSDVSGFNARGTSVDGALRLMLTKNVTLGLVVRNAFSRYSYTDGADFKREREFALGVSTAATQFARIEGDMVWAHGDPSRWLIGAESDYLFGLLALRAGFAVIKAGESRSLPYFGFGVRYSRLTLHYNANFDKETAFADTHRFTLSVSL